MYDPGQDDDGSVSWDGGPNLLGDGLEPADDTPDYVDADDCTTTPGSPSSKRPPLPEVITSRT